MSVKGFCSSLSLVFTTLFSPQASLVSAQTTLKTAQVAIGHTSPITAAPEKPTVSLVGTPTIPKSDPIQPEELNGALEQVRWQVKNPLKKDPEVTKFSSENLIFKVNGSPFIFKSIYDLGYPSREESLRSVLTRYDQSLAAKKLVEEYNLNRIIVPDCHLFYIDDVPVIAERALPSLETSNDKKQELLYAKAHDDIELATQLATFLTLSNLGDVEPRNFPIIEQDNGVRQIAIIDTDRLDTGLEALVGDELSLSDDPTQSYGRGLISCLHSEAQIDAAIQIFMDAGKFPKEEMLSVAGKAKAARLERLAHASASG